MPTPQLTENELLEAVSAWREAGKSVMGGAKLLGMNYSGFKYRLEKAKQNGLHLSRGARHVVNRAGLSGTEARGGWIHDYDDDGKKVGTTRWTAPQIETEAFAESLSIALSNIPSAPDTPPPDISERDLLTLYPVSDLHAGMRAWGEETGEDYDTEKATRRLFSWLSQCVDASPASGTAVILLNGDTLHADDQTNQTPASRHVLDMDTRYHMTLDLTVTAIAAAAEYAAKKHGRVIIVTLPGNHDPHAYLAVMMALFQRYREHNRIDVKNRPGEWWVHQFGDVMLAAHHGHRAKADRMVHFLADDYAPIWGRTKYRYLWTGHLHHHKSQDIGGVQHEQLRAVTARDAYAVGHAYTARAQMQAITYHRQKGELQRFKVGL